jgi:hypothetical protein
MSYVNLIDSNLTMAFNLVKDLAKPAVLNKKGNVSFDFETGTTKTSNNSNTAIKVIVTDISKKSKEHNAVMRQVMFKAKGLGDIKMYDSLLIDNEVWNFGNFLKSEGYIIVAEIFKEV